MNRWTFSATGANIRSRQKKGGIWPEECKGNGERASNPGTEMPGKKKPNQTVRFSKQLLQTRGGIAVPPLFFTRKEFYMELSLDSNVIADHAEENSMETNLFDVVGEAKVPDRKIGTLVGNNLGHNTLVASTPMREFFEISEVASERNIETNALLAGSPVAQRTLDRKHAERLAVYLLKGLVNTLVSKLKREKQAVPSELLDIRQALGEQPYMSLQPVVANIRDIGFGGASGLRFERTADGLVYVWLRANNLLWVVDGQHRRWAMKILFDYLLEIMTTQRYPKRPMLYPAGSTEDKLAPGVAKVWAQLREVAVQFCTVTVEIHLGLNAEQERQLFHDLNNLGKPVEASMAFDYDLGNPVNQWIKDVLIKQGVLTAKVVEKDVVDWRKDDGVIARKDLVAVCAMLFLNKTSVSGALPHVVSEKAAVAHKFWQTVGAIEGFGEDEAKQKTVAAQPVVLKAIAKLVYDFAYGRNCDAGVSADILLDRILAEIDFSHDNPMWRYYQLDPDKRKKLFPGLATYLPDEASGNRDIGAYSDEAKVMRFGAKHNDIYPIIGDMIRWKLKLPNRQAATLDQILEKAKT
jgi:hypothetical protein